MTPGDALRETDTADLAGRQFHLLERIGRGSFGDVYLAEQESEGGFRRRVVLKVLNEDVARLRAATRQLRNEARVLGLLVHRHIVAVLDLVRFEDRWAILMDYVPGADLERVLDALSCEKHEPFPVPAALEVGAAVCDALHVAIHTVVPGAHGGGGLLSVIHRDIKPSNIKLTPDGEIKVLDFGVARFSLDGIDPGPTAAWAGTERYMSPERIRCEGDTPAGDIYATAATVVELILGRPLGQTPVLGEEHRQFVEDALALVRCRIHADHRIVDRLVALLRRALDAEPAIRPGARAMYTSLEALAREIRGESLKQFARRFVPRVDDLLGRTPWVVSATLLEGMTSPTLVAPADGPERDSLVPPAGPAPQPLPLAPPVPRRSVAHASPPPAPPRPRRKAWVPVVLQVGGLVAGGVAGIVVGPLIAVAMVMHASRAPVPAVLVVPPIQGNLVVDVADAHPDDAFGRTLLGAPLFPGSQPDLVAVIFNPSSSPTQPVTEARVDVEDATEVTVTCGEVVAVGRSSVLIADFRPGTCTIGARWFGSVYETELPIDASRAVRCRVDSRVLRCS